MRRKNWRSGLRKTAMMLSAGTVFQLGGCDFGQITVSQSINANDLVISVIRGAILNPIDAFLTQAVNDALGVSE